MPAHLNVYDHSLIPPAIKLWNHLPATTIESNNIDDFKKDCRIVDYRLNVVCTVFFVCTAYILPNGGPHSILINKPQCIVVKPQHHIWKLHIQFKESKSKPYTL